jgi:hypothetical protein
MLRKILNKIESKRKSKNLFWKNLIWLKDFSWKYANLDALPSLFNIALYDLKTKINKNENKKKSINSPRKRKIHFVYFTCKKHFPYLVASLKSLKKLNLRYIRNLYLYVDKKDFLSKYQQDLLRKEFSFNILIRKTRYKMSWGGPKVIINELTAFKEILKDINSNDYLAKVDSDVLFISDNIFKKILKSKKYSLIGQAHNVSNSNIRHIQGGCYFLKGNIIHEITCEPISKLIKKTLDQTNQKISLCSEDVAMFNLIKNKTNNIKFIDFYLPLNKTNKLTQKDRQKYSITHFEQCKEKMLNFS